MIAPAGLFFIIVVGLLVFGGLMLIVAVMKTGGSRTCPKCGASNRLDARFCGTCGQQIR